MHYFWVIVAITLSAAGAFFVVPFTKNTIGGEAKTSNVVEADRLAMEKEEEVVKGAGVIGHGKVAYYGHLDFHYNKSEDLLRVHWQR